MDRLTNNEVAEVAQMQKHIDNLEACFENLWFNISHYEQPMRNMLLKDKDRNSAYFYNEIWKFLRFCKENHPEIKEEIMRKERQERQEQIRRQQERKAKKRKPFLKRFFYDVLPPL